MDERDATISPKNTVEDRRAERGFHQIGARLALAIKAESWRLRKQIGNSV